MALLHLGLFSLRCYRSFSGSGELPTDRIGFVCKAIQEPRIVVALRLGDDHQNGLVSALMEMHGMHLTLIVIQGGADPARGPVAQ